MVTVQPQKDNWRYNELVHCIINFLFIITVLAYERSKNMDTTTNGQTPDINETPVQNNDNISNEGFFQAFVTSSVSGRPVENASLEITYPDFSNTAIDNLTTDQSGKTPVIKLRTPPLQYSLTPLSSQPYSVYNIIVRARGYEEVEIAGAEIFPGETAIQNISLIPLDESEPESAEVFVIPPHTLYAEYPPKIPEDEIKDINESGEVVLSRVVIPDGVRF